MEKGHDPPGIEGDVDQPAKRRKAETEEKQNKKAKRKTQTGREGHYQRNAAKKRAKKELWGQTKFDDVGAE